MKAVLIAVGFVFSLGFIAAEEKPERLKPIKTWNGILKDESLRTEVPFGGDDPRAKEIKVKVGTTINREDQWQRVWKAWRGEEEVPAVDFAENFIVVVTASGGNRVEAVPELDKDGNLKVYAWSKSDESKGFGYQFAVLSRKGIKTLAGKRMECGRNYCMCHISTNNPPNVPMDVETDALAKKITGICWGDLASFEVRTSDAEAYPKIMEMAFAEAAKSKRTVLVLAQIGALGDETLKSALADGGVLQRLRKEFVLVAVPTNARAKLGPGLKLIAYNGDQKPIHTLEWGVNRRVPLPYAEKQHETNVKAVDAFLRECLEKVNK